MSEIRPGLAGPSGIGYSRGHSWMRIPMSRPERLLFSIALCVSLSASADPGPKLGLPLDCAIPDTCQIQNHFDHQPGPGFRDYACGHLGYDGHDGVDLRLPNLAVMAQGVPVLAAAAGRIRAVRDSMPDVSVREVGRRDTIRGQEAGNGVVISHGESWETQYSHMRRGSVRVRPGDRVVTGQVLGLVGLSGNTEFPHLHFEVRHEGRPVDPFVGLARGDECAPGEAPLWDAAALAALSYRPTGLLQAGFAGQAPDSRSVERGELDATELTDDVPVLVFWVEVFGVRMGDRETLQLVAPDGRVLAERQITLERNLARRFGYVGKKRPLLSWQRGEYRGRYRLLREEKGQTRTVLEVDRVLRVR